MLEYCRHDEHCPKVATVLHKGNTWLCTDHYLEVRQGELEHYRKEALAARARKQHLGIPASVPVRDYNELQLTSFDTQLLKDAGVIIE